MKQKDQEPQQKQKKPRTAMIRVAAALAALLLLFSGCFFGVSLLLDDAASIEREYSRLGTDAEMGISIADLSNATQTLFDYMKGKRNDIRISVMVNGTTVEDLFYHEKEIVHMEEVRALWRTLSIAAIVGTAAAFGLFTAILFFGAKNTRLRNTGAGMMTGSLIFAGVIVAMVLWVIGDFNSFWTVFHFIIFPKSLIEFIAGGMTVTAYNELNWVFESSFAMIRMLGGLFFSLVLRAGLIFGVEIAVVLLIGLLFYRRGHRLDQVGSDIVEVRTIEEEERYTPVADAPDLVLQHKLRNASLEQKKKLMEELRKPPEERTEEPPIEPTPDESEPEPADGPHKSTVPFADVAPDENWQKPEPTEPGKETEQIENELF